MKPQSYNTFWQKIHRAAKNRGFPLRVMFELTYRCNFYCRHCYVPFSYRKKGELKTEEVFSILNQLKDIGCFYLGFTGGEPFTRKDIMEILWYAKRSGFEIIIYTNGSLINEKIAEELSCLRPNKLDITIPAMSEIAFERISGVSGSRDKVFKAIALLHKNKVDLGFKTCVLKESEREIEEIQKFAKSLGALHRLDTMLSARLNGSREPYKYRGSLSPFSSLGSFSSFSSGKQQNLTNCDFTNSSSITKITNLFKCGVGVSQVAITPQGELKMCLMIDYPKYKILDNYVARHTSHVTRKKRGLEEAWERLKEFVSSIRPDKNYQCYKCEFQPYCKWCPARSWLYNRNFTSCEPERRTWAEYRKRLFNC